MKVVIVGAGITGLYNAYILAKKGHSVTLIEKEKEVGGLARTFSYEKNGEKYYFDIGPHIPPNGDKVWKFFCSNTKEITNVPLPIKVSLTLRKFKLNYPIELKSLPYRYPIELMKLGAPYILSQFIKIKEENLRDSLINLWGVGFYNRVFHYYMSNFWKSDPKNISTSFKGRVKPPDLKYLLKSYSKSTIARISSLVVKKIFPKKKDQRKLQYKTLNSENKRKLGAYPYPEKGIWYFIPDLLSKFNNLKIEILKNSMVTKIKYNHDNNEKINLTIENNENNEMNNITFDKMIWTAPIPDLLELLGLKEEFSKLRYNHLIIINLIINKRRDLLGDKVHTEYLMRDNIIFHRVYEPNKLSKAMTPADKTSICIEITLNKTVNIEKKVKIALQQFKKLYNLKDSDIDLLDYKLIKNVYPFLYKGYERDYNNLLETLKNNYPNIYLAGRLGHYSSYNMAKALSSIVEF